MRRVKRLGGDGACMLRCHCLIAGSPSRLAACQPACNRLPHPPTPSPPVQGGLTSFCSAFLKLNLASSKSCATCSHVKGVARQKGFSLGKQKERVKDGCGLLHLGRRAGLLPGSAHSPGPAGTPWLRKGGPSCPPLHTAMRSTMHGMQSRKVHSGG